MFPIHPMQPFRVPGWTKGVAFVLGLGTLAGCGALQPGTPGHEPPSAGRYNPVSGEVNSSGR